MGSGLVVQGQIIVTNAHTVTDNTFVLVRMHGVGHGCDLAILTVESEEFWKRMNLLELGDILFVQEAVAVAGYPQKLLSIFFDAGGHNISVTKGCVSRVEPTQYGPTENAKLRKHLQLCPEMTGVLSKINSLSEAHKMHKKDDIVLAFDVPFRNREQVIFDHLVSMKKPNETVLRDGVEKDISLTLQPYGEDWCNTSPRWLCERVLHELPNKAEEQLVILAQVFMDDINGGYEHLAELQLTKVNGVEVQNLNHLCGFVEECKEERLRFDLDGERVVVLNYESAKVATSQVIKES
ncbi:hypothetical protein MKW98_022656 [Papaver atlanticum]|uniref:Protease Do-like PDZ domain-containing protein n=1 Tax=Papaver atlanticum TaxID=357466 RepID=A0AAD4T4G2_9MAGN|nr:hypothetical protein MKW98_022656 [Papaver atlanticum]